MIKKRFNNSFSKAFSLIELSIVILVIGVLIAGVIQGNSILKKSQLSTARSLTTSSPVSGIKDLAVWYETSLESSFKATESLDNTAVSTWYDNNPQTISKINASQGTSTNQPKFYENSFPNGIPGIRFDGTNDYLPFDGTFLAGSAYTIFIIEQRRSSTSGVILAGSSNAGNNLNLHFVYFSDTRIRMGQWGNDLTTADIAALTFDKGIVPKMHTGWLDKTVGHKYWFNGGITSDASNLNTTPLISWNGATIGAWVTQGYCNCDIAEMIIFTRALKTEERQSIESYLGKKYSITIS